MCLMNVRHDHIIDRPDERGNRRTKTLQLRVSPQEHSVMMHEAGRYGLPVSAWLRLLAQSAIERGRLRRGEPVNPSEATRRPVAGNGV